MKNIKNSKTTRDGYPNEYYGRSQSGFGALTSVMLLAFGLMAFAVSTMASAREYAHSVWLREWRIQNNLNQEACKDIAILKSVKDYFWDGNIGPNEFGC